MSTTLPDHIIKTVHDLQEPLNLDRWIIKLEHGDLPDTAACSAMPEYKQATIGFNLDKLATGDELDEIIVHEMMHCHTWPSFELAELLAKLVSEMLPEPVRAATYEAWMEQVRLVGEDTNTQVSYVVIKLLRRLWAAQAEVKELRKQLKAMDKTLKTG